MLVFKIIGLMLGARLASVQGMVIGVLIGHALDAGLSVQIAKTRARKHQQRLLKQQANEVFFVSLFSMLAKLVHADGQLHREELTAVETVIDFNLSLNRKQRQRAMQVFTQAAVSPTKFHYFASQFGEVFRAQPWVLESVIDILFRVAVSDGELHSREERLIASAAEIFEMPHARYKQILAQYSETLAEAQRAQSQNGIPSPQRTGSPYAVLGCAKTASPEEIKQRYRQLVSAYHPDRIISKDLPEGFLQFAHEKFHEIQNAYRTIKQERGFS